ncbi:MAG: calcium-binding protein [Leptolyngbyaceae cyanobacterium SM1_3_5]|nr:calcium-binding protein [Leptolyngbyaceae cyanobacterium SM1_3_5]
MLNGLAGDDTYFVGTGDRILEGADAGIDLVNAAVSFTLGANLENLVLQEGAGDLSGRGNALNNTITGNEGNNSLNGDLGADTLTGGAGNDIYFVDNLEDVVIETSETDGLDLVQSSVSFTLGENVENLTLTGSISTNGTGNALDNSIAGNSANNTIDGSTGADIMAGGRGDDTYFVDNPGDRVIEATGGGNDTVITSVDFSLALNPNIETVSLLGNEAANLVGDDRANTLIGNNADNTLLGLGSNDVLIGNEGNDFLDGGTGIDVMNGGAGDDTFVVDSDRDRIIGAENDGLDTVISSVSYVLADNLENLTLIGNALFGQGNGLNNVITGNNFSNTLLGLQGDDTLLGGAGNDTLLGGEGIDSMNGGEGNDVYGVDNANDTVIDSGGIDRVQAFINYSLGEGIENLTLLGTAAEGRGNDSNNTIIGTAGDNFLDGELGADLLNGGLGMRHLHRGQPGRSH